MAHFAEIGLNNTVIQVIVVNNSECLDENNEENEAVGAAFCRNLFGGTWIQTSYNKNIRKNFADIGFTYDTTRDAFIPPKPYDSWTLDEETCQWQAPIDMPTGDAEYLWDEDNQQWLEV